MSRAEISDQESRLLGLLTRRMSDKQRATALGISLSQAIALAVALREKLGTAPGETIVQAARRHGLVAS